MNSIKYLDHIRTIDCLICFEPSEAHHLKQIGMGNNRSKPSPKHYSAVPLCTKHHQEFHAKGIKRFEEEYQINLWKNTNRIISGYLYDIEKKVHI